MAVTLHICTTCRAGETPAEGEPCAGERLFAALERAGTVDELRLRPVICLAACGRGCIAALSGPGRWTYLYGGLSEADAPDILAGLRAYAATPDGIVPWRDRPAIFRRQTLARIPFPED